MSFLHVFIRNSFVEQDITAEGETYTIKLRDGSHVSIAPQDSMAGRVHLRLRDWAGDLDEEACIELLQRLLRGELKIIETVRGSTVVKSALQVLDRKTREYEPHSESHAKRVPLFGRNVERVWLAPKSEGN